MVLIPGDQIAFWEGNENRRGWIKRVPVGGGPPQPVVEHTGTISGMSWSSGVIVYATVGGIYRVDDVGGTPELIVPEDVSTGERYRFPQLVDDGRQIVFTAGTDLDQARIVLRDLASGDEVVLAERGQSGRILPTGHLVFSRDGALFASPVDLARRTAGSAVLLIEDVRVVLTAQFAVSDTGVLAFIPGDASTTRALAWVDRRGVIDPIGTDVLAYDHPRFSPDGTKIVGSADGANGNIEVWDSVRGTSLRVTSDGLSDAYPVWIDDRQLLYSRRGGLPGPGRLFRRAADGTGVAEPLFDGDDVRPMSLSPDGMLLYQAPGTNEQSTLMFRPLDGSADARPVAGADAGRKTVHHRP